MTKISEVLALETVEVNDGDILTSVTRSEGYLPTFKENTALAQGKYNFKVAGVGEADEVTGKYAAHNVIPFIMNEDNTELVVDAANPVVVQVAGKVTYMIGRNHPNFKDGYQDRQVRVIEDITEGEEHRKLLEAFADFVKTEYSLGVNDFNIEGPEHS